MALRIIPQLGRINLENWGRTRVRFRMTWIWHVLYIVYSLEVGLFLLFLPWLGIWDNNYLVYLYPRIHPIVTNSYLKGAVLGLGLVNIVIGVQEIVLLRKRSRPRSSK